MVSWEWKQVPRAMTQIRTRPWSPDSAQTSIQELQYAEHPQLVNPNLVS